MLDKVHHPILYILLLLLFASPLHANERGLLWSVQKEGQPTSYLFGTIHSEDPRVLNLPARVREALAGADSFAMEIELNAEVSMALSRHMLLDGERSLEEILGEELYRYTLQAMVRRGMSEPQVARLKPWAVMLTLSVPPPRTGQFLDMMLYQHARVAGKQIISLETVDEVVAVFDDMSMEEQRRLLYETLAQYRNFPQLFEALISAYLMRDLDGLMALQESSLSFGGDDPLKQHYAERLIDDRNSRMLERLVPHIKKQSVFVAVGALHLPGESGLITQLRERGYRVEPIY